MNADHEKRLILLKIFSVAKCAYSSISIDGAYLPHYSQKRQKLIWGPTPIISNTYWSRALREVGWDSITLMSQYYSINKKTDFDLYYEDVVPGWVPKLFRRRAIVVCFVMIYVVQQAKVIHMPFHGGPFGQTILWRLEAYLFRWTGVRTILMPYGGDAYMYSKTIDPLLRHALLLSYPELARQEAQTTKRVRYWEKHADIVVTGYMIDSMGRWDVLASNIFCIDCEAWSPKTNYSDHDGRSGAGKNNAYA